MKRKTKERYAQSNKKSQLKIDKNKIILVKKTTLSLTVNKIVKKI